MGAFALAALLRRYGLGQTLDALRPLGAWLPLLFALEALGKALNVWALQAIMPPGRKGAPGFGALLDAVLQADAVNYLLPTASLGGNALLIRRLGRPLGTAEATAVVTTANSAQTISQFLFVLIGAALAAGSFAPSRELRLGLWATAFVSVFVIALSVAVQMGSPFGVAHALMKRLGVRVPYLLERENQITALDARLRESLSARPGAFAACVLLFGLGWAWSAVELAAALSLMGVEADWRTILAIEALAAFVDALVFFVPAKAGAQEGGKILAFTLAGLPAGAGLAFGLLRRARELVWTVLGYLLLLRRRRRAP